jgi:predicted transcriptional regulator
MINKLDEKQVRSINLFNIKTNITYTINTDMTQLEKIIEILIEHKKMGKVRKNDREFLNKCAKVTEKFGEKLVRDEEPENEAPDDEESDDDNDDPAEPMSLKKGISLL